MNQRIAALTKLTLEGKLYAQPKQTVFSPEDTALSPQLREARQLCEFILNQEPVLTEFSRMTGFFNCNSSVVGDGFRRMGHKYTQEVLSRYYLKPQESLSTMEWQHATADYRKVLAQGIRGILAEIEDALLIHAEPEKREFLLALREVAQGLIHWAHKCAQ